MTSAGCEYLVAFGKSGDFGRFAASEPLACRRGDFLVIETGRGLELGTVIRTAEPEHARLLGGGLSGRIVRRPDSSDLSKNEDLRNRGRKLFQDARDQSARLGLPLEVIDAEILFDGRQAVLHTLRWGDFEANQLIEPLSRAHALLMIIQDLALPHSVPEPEPVADHGCGSGGCSSGGCGSGGGCSSGGCGSCSSHAAPAPVVRPHSVSLL